MDLHLSHLITKMAIPTLLHFVNKCKLVYYKKYVYNLYYGGFILIFTE